MKNCKATKKDGTPCNAHPQTGSDYCFYHDPDKKEERHKAQLKGARSPRRSIVALEVNIDLADPEQVRAVMASMLREVIDTEPTQRINIITKARCVGYLGAKLLQAIELSDIDDRITALEKAREANEKK